MTDLRTRRHELTRDALFEAAVDLFDEHGFGGVTMEQVAAAAGVSRRTAYRRFATKDELMLELPRRWLAAWDRCIAELGDDVAPRDAVEAACCAVAAHVDEHPRNALVGLRVLAEAPGLGEASVSSESWKRRIVDQLDRDPAGARLPAVEQSIIAGAYLGAIDAMLATWGAAGGSWRLVDDTRTLLARLRPIWPI